jgi:D-xylose transport system ATP-binding protein
MPDERGTPLVELRDMSKAFGGIRAVDHVSFDLYPGEVMGVLGHNGAGKSVLMKMLSGALPRDGGQILINGEEAIINNPRDARKYNIETIYQTLALADNLDAASNLFLGRELVTRFGMVDDATMEAETRKIMRGSTRTSAATRPRSRASRAVSGNRWPSRGRSISTPRS